MFGLFSRKDVKEEKNFKSTNDVECIPDSLNHGEYSMDFTGAEHICVRYNDTAKPDEPAEEHAITEKRKIAEIVSLLNRLPREGHIMKKMAPGQRTSLIAVRSIKGPKRKVREEEAFAHVTFFGPALKAENTGFYGHTGDEVAKLEKELYRLIERTL